MNVSRAFFAGVVGAGIMTLVFGIGRALGVHVQIELLLGSWVTGRPSWLLGLLLHLGLGGIFGLIYCEVFHRGLRRGSVLGGAGLGAIHALIAGFLLALLPSLHPLIPHTLAPPGIFMGNEGTGAVAIFIIAHLVYGMVVGGLYEPRAIRVPGRMRAQPRT